MGNSINIDFSSSGHAKDAKSFGRFGFRFGFRPVYGGRGGKGDVQKVVNTLKLVTVCVAASIENLTYLEKENKN